MNPRRLGLAAPPTASRAKHATRTLPPSALRRPRSQEHRSWLAAGMALLLGACGVRAQAQTAPRLAGAEAVAETRAETIAEARAEAAVGRLRAAAEATPFLAIEDLFWLRDLSGQAPAADLARHRFVAQAVVALRRHPEATADLLDDASPRVRALAAVALLRTTRAEYLEPVAALADDEGTIPVLQRRAVVPPTDPDALAKSESASPSIESWTVGAFVRRALLYRQCPEPDAEGFAEFVRDETAHGATPSSLKLLLQYPVAPALPAGNLAPETLTELVRSLPRAAPGAREISRIGLLGEHVERLRDHCPDLAWQLRADARSLGRENVLRLVLHQAVEIDGHTWDYPALNPVIGGFAAWVFTDPVRAGLRAEDAQALLKTARRTGSVDRFHAAQQLAPAQALTSFREAAVAERQPFRGVVHETFTSFDLAWFLFERQHDGEAAAALAEWLTFSTPQPGERLALGPRLQFARRLAFVPPPARQPVLAATLASPDFERCDRRIVEALAIALGVPDARRTALDAGALSVLDFPWRRAFPGELPVLPDDPAEAERTTKLRKALRARVAEEASSR